jgi:diacylglycerol kinase family enzyme
VAAGLSLLALAAAVVTAVVAFLRDPLVLPLTLIGLAVAVIVGWMSLISRGRRRLVTGLIALVVFAAVLVLLTRRSLLWMLVVVVLVVLGQLCARYAFGHQRAMVASATAARPVRRARKGVLLMNPRSGGAKVDRFHLIDEARRRGIEPMVLREGDDLRALAETAVAQGADVLGMAGGDGSQALVADVARRHGLPFVCVPAGTRNHFALDLGLDRNDVTAALDAFGEAVERRVDIGTVAGRIFVNNASLGVYATIVASPDYRDAKLATTASLLPDLAEAGEFDLRFDGPDGAPRETADLLLVSNNPYVTRQLSGVGTRPRLDTGQLGLLAVRGNRPQEESHRRAVPDIEEWTASTFRVDSARPVPVGIDGESLELEPPLEFTCLPAALRVRLPRTAPGAGSTPVYGVRATIGALLGVLFNRP